MIDNWVKKGLVFAIIILFISVSFQPIIAEKTVSVEKESDYNNVDFNEAKEYLFQTIIDISNNPDVKNLFEQLKYNHRMFTSDYDYKSAFSQIFFKNPRLLLSILFIKPFITYEHLNKSYKKGIDCVNFVGEKQALELAEGINISNPEIFNNLNRIILNDKKLSDRISTLEIMNNNLKPDSPFQDYPIICAILVPLYFIMSAIIYIIANSLVKMFQNFRELVLGLVNIFILILYGSTVGPIMVLLYKYGCYY